jgi:hypothetical protein
MSVFDSNLSVSAAPTLMLHHHHHHLPLEAGVFGDNSVMADTGDGMSHHEATAMMMMMQSPDDVKLPTPGHKANLLRMYGRKLGLNERGCHVALALAAVAFLLLLIVVAMTAAWPSESHSINKRSAMQSSLSC